MNKTNVIILILLVALAVTKVLSLLNGPEPEPEVDNCLHQNRVKLETVMHCPDCGVYFMELPDIESEALTMKGCIMIVDPNEAGKVIE